MVAIAERDIRINQQIPQEIYLSTQLISFDQIHEVFAKTEGGIKLDKNIRFGDYKPSWMKNEEWEEWLGADVNNLQHMPLTNVLTRSFLRYFPEDAFTLEEQEDLRLAAIVHDWGESIKGHEDTRQDRTPVERQRIEFEKLQQMAGNVVEGLKIYRQDKEVLTHRIENVVENVVKNRESKVGKAFNAIERIGYLRTAVRAWEFSRNPNLNQETSLHDEELRIAFESVTNNVLLNQIPKLLEYATIYPPIQMFLESHAETITNAFEEMHGDIFLEYTGEEQPQQKIKFANAKNLWTASPFFLI
jgi:hypothetical protein